MYKGEADWSLIRDVKENQRMNIPVFGNGDVDTPEKAKLMKDTYGIDGIMIGRASIGNPWVFNEIKHYLETGQKLAPAKMPQRIEAARRHLEMAIDWKGEKLGIFETRRHYANYFKGFPHFKEIRMALVTLETQDELFGLLNKVKLDYSERELV